MGSMVVQHHDSLCRIPQPRNEILLQEIKHVAGIGLVGDFEAPIASTTADHTNDDDAVTKQSVLDDLELVS